MERNILKFQYIGRTGFCNNHYGIITIASLFRKDENVIELGITFCSPKDVYSKQIGKRKATHRLENVPIVISNFEKPAGATLLCLNELQRIHDYDPHRGPISLKTVYGNIVIPSCYSKIVPNWLSNCLEAYKFEKDINTNTEKSGYIKHTINLFKRLLGSNKAMVCLRQVT